jgi:hypothetical protein
MRCLGRTETDRKDYERAVVVEAEFSGTKKTTLRSEWSNAPKKQKKNENKRRKIQQKLDRAGTVRDAW